MRRSLIVFSYDYPPSTGGIARLCHEIAVGMASYYQSVTVLTRKKNGESIPYNFKSVKVIELPMQRFFCEISAWNYLRRLKNKENVDVVCGLWHPEGAISLLAGVKNTFILAHGTELLYGDSKFRKYIWLPAYARLILKYAKKVIANSKYTQSLIRNVSPKSKNFALPLAVNHEFFKPAKVNRGDGLINFCTVSRILKFKGYDFIAKTIAGLPIDIRKRIRWNIAGTGTYLDELKHLIEELGISTYVKFHGFVPDPDLPKFYNSNDIFILCTREQSDSTSVEGFGLVFLEAQACGLPAIGTRTGGIPDAVYHENGGWLIAQDNQEELTDVIVRLVKDTNIITDMGQIARLRVEENCTWQHYCESLRNILT